MTTDWSWNLNILYPELAAVPLTVYFLIGLIIMMAFAIVITCLAQMFEGTFRKFILKWSILTVFLNVVLLTNDLLHIFFLK